jgi:ABC-type nitrate/sulfonate/bicarbonate transport system permease component
MAMSQRVREFLSPLVEFFRTVPGIVAIPFTILWFGIARTAQLLFMAYYTFMLMVIYTYEATRNVLPVYTQFASTLGADSRQQFRHVVIPAIIPEIVGGFRVVIMAGFGCQVVAELAGSGKGMGRVFHILSQYYKVDQIIAGIILIVLVAVGVDQIFTAVMKRILRWLPREGE